MVIRPATEADRPEWLKMRQALWPEESEGEHANLIGRFFQGGVRDPLQVLLAIGEDEEVVGFAELSIRSYAEGCETDRVAFLEGWYVVPWRRRRGVGAALIERAVDWAQSQGCLEFASDAELDNALGAAAHVALGFVETAQLRCFRKAL